MAINPEGEEINPRKGEDNYQNLFLNGKRTYDNYQDLDLVKARNQESERAQAAIDAQAMKVKLDHALITQSNALITQTAAQNFNILMNQAGANRLWFETEIPEAAALSEVLKTSKLGTVDLLQWMKTLVTELEEAQPK